MIEFSTPEPLMLKDPKCMIQSRLDQCGQGDFEVRVGQTWLPVTPILKDHTILLQAQDTIDAVRYAWGNYPLVSLYVGSQRPVLPLLVERPRYY